MTQESAEVPVDDGRCIGCGPYSEIGLKMQFETGDSGDVHGSLVIPQRFQGWQGVVHGGIVALVLDEAMAYAAGARGVIGMTADLKMRFRNSVPVGAILAVRGKVLWQRRNILGIEASISDAAGTLLASAVGSFVSRGKLAEGQRLGAVRVVG